MTTEQLYTSLEIAEKLSLNPQTVLRFIREKKLRAVKVGRSYRIKQAHLDEYLKG